MRLRSCALLMIMLSLCLRGMDETPTIGQASPYKLPLHRAIYSQQEDAFNKLTPTLPTIINTVEIEPNGDHRFGDRPLHVAVQYGTESMIHALLACPALDMTPLNKQYKNALHLAIEFKRPKALLFKLLRTWRASEQYKAAYKAYLDRYWYCYNFRDPFIDAGDKEGISPFNRAFSMQFDDGMDVLLQYSAHTNTRDGHGRMPLNEMIKKGDYAWVNKMANHACDRKMQDMYGRTPLHLALIYAKSSAIPYKLCIGVEKLAEIQDHDGKTPLHWVAMLHVAEGPSLINTIAGHDNYGINIRDKSGHTPLHKAIIHNNYDSSYTSLTIPTLVKHGASLDESDNDGNRPLELALEVSLELTLKLIEWGANPNLQNKDGNTPLHTLIQRGDRNDWIQPFIKAGARDDIPNNNGITPAIIMQENKSLF